jgi:hypothetical protein
MEGSSMTVLSSVPSRIDGVVDTEHYLLGLHNVAGSGPTALPTSQRFKRLIEQALYVLRRFSRRRNSAEPSIYLAFSIGPEVLAVGVYELDAQNDEDALEKATSLFHDELKRVEVWCGSRKVGDIPPGSGEGSEAKCNRELA